MIELDATTLVFPRKEDDTFKERLQRTKSICLLEDWELVDILKRENYFVAIVFAKKNPPYNESSFWNYFIVESADAVYSARIETPSARVGKNKEIERVDIQDEEAKVYLDTLHDDDTVVTVYLTEPSSSSV